MTSLEVLQRKSFPEEKFISKPVSGLLRVYQATVYLKNCPCVKYHIVGSSGKHFLGPEKNPKDTGPCHPEVLRHECVVSTLNPAISAEIVRAQRTPLASL